MKNSRIIITSYFLSRGILLFIFFYLVESTFAQQFRNISISKGLSSHQAFSIVQDETGFIWISTKTGIDRFDGENITSYCVDEQKESSIFEKIVLRCDNNNHLWAFSVSGSIYSFSYESNNFELKYRLKEKFNKEYGINDITFNKYIWLATNFGLCYIDDDGKAVRDKALMNKNLSVISNYKDHSLLIGSRNLYQFDTETKTVKQLAGFSTSDENSFSDQLQCIYFDPKEPYVWCGNGSGNIYRVDTRDNTYFDLNSKISGLPAAPIYKIVASKNGHLFIGSDGGGIFEIDKKTFRLIHTYREEEDNPLSLKGNGIQDLYFDKTGILYALSYTGGVNILNNDSGPFTIINHEIRNPNSLGNDVVNSILEDEDHDIWCATNNGISLWIKKENRWRHFLNDPQQSTSVFLSLCEGEKGKMLVGSYSDGLFVIDKKKGVISTPLKNLSTKDKKNTARYISDIYRNGDEIWLCDIFSTISIWNYKTNTIKSLPISGVYSISKKNKKEIFAGTSSGLYEINLETYKIKHIVVEGKIPSDIFINSILYDGLMSELWIATSGQGIINLNVNSNKIRTYKSQEGLPTNHIYSIIKIKNDVWASTEKGISRINATNKIENFTMRHGISDENFYRNSKLLSSDGQIYFGSFQGITVFKPKEVVFKDKSTNIFMNDFRIFNESVYASQKDVLKKPLNDTQLIVLKHNQNTISFNFTLLQPPSAGKTNYSWILQGLENEWSTPSNNNTASYTNLTHGKYVFKLKAYGNRFEKILDEREIEIIVRPSVWNTIMARIIYILLFFFILRVIYYFIRINDKRQLSDAKILFFTNTAHDIRTPLSLVNAPLSDLSKSEILGEKENHLLNISLKNLSKLTKMVDQLLDFQKADNQKSQLILSETDIVSTVEEKIISFNVLATEKNIKLIFHKPKEQLIEWVDVVKWDKIMDNLFSNAVKYSYNNSEIEISIDFTQTNWNLTVIDKGIGISKKAQKNIFKRYYRSNNAINSKNIGTGIGLLLTKNYVNLHKGDISFEREEGMGTKFFLSFKRGKSHFGRRATFIESSGIRETQIPYHIPEEAKIVAKEETKMSKTKLLIVEDNDELRNYLCESISLRYIVKSAENGLVALNILKKFSPDIVISDVGMPEMNGIELAHQIKNNFITSHIPIILLTAYTEKQDVIKGLQSGADDYITKPFDISLLIIRVENMIKNRQAVKERFLLQIDHTVVPNKFSNKKDEEFIQKAIDFVENNIASNNLSRKVFSEAMFVSESVLFQKLKTLTGQTPSAFISILKLRKAAKLLKEGELSLSEVTSLAGFLDTKYFSTSFKKFYGKTPSEYRKESLQPH